MAAAVGQDDNAGDSGASTVPLIVILGPTASGKTGVAIKLAKDFGGEIVCADSRSVYSGLDIGTAKPTPAERASVPHHLLDVVKPDEPYNLARFQREANEAIADIRHRGKVPFLVGGSGLYVDSIVFNYGLTNEPDAVRRGELEAMTLAELFHYSNEHNVELPNNLYNKRYVIRAIEQGGINRSRRNAPVENIIIVGITTKSDVLKRRIATRASAMFLGNVIDEATTAAIQYGWDIAPLQAPAYRIARQYIEHTLTLDDAITAQARADWQLARKQMTWFRRNKYINWMPLSEVAPFVRHKLAQ